MIDVTIIPNNDFDSIAFSFLKYQYKVNYSLYNSKSSDTYNDERDYGGNYHDCFHCLIKLIPLNN